MDEFIKVLMEQIRCVKAREGILKEIQDHIDDQAECYEMQGMEHEKAVEEAVRQMGDPVVIGTRLDHIHRPQMDIRMLVMVIAFSIMGIGLQSALGVFADNHNMLLRQCMFTGIGLLLMVGVYFLDYSFVGKHAKLLYVMMIGFTILVTCSPFFSIFAFHGMYNGMIMPMHLFVPIYAGLLYQHRGEGYLGIVKMIGYMILPFLCSIRCIPSLPTAVHLFGIFLAMILYAIYKNWFMVKKKMTISLLLGTGIGLPIVFSIFAYFCLMADYQKMRIEAWLNPPKYASEEGFYPTLLRRTLANSKWIGGSSAEDFWGKMNDSSFVLTQLMVSYGMIVGVFICVALLLMILHAFKISIRQKNQLGMMLGIGCGLTIAFIVIEGIAVNLCLLPSTTVILPFLSYGIGTTITYDILFGILLSVYRYQNILEDKKYRKKWQLDLKIKKLNE